MLAVETDAITIPSITVLEDLSVIYSYLKNCYDKVEKNIPEKKRPPNLKKQIFDFKPLVKTEVKKLQYQISFILTQNSLSFFPSSLNNEQLLKRGAIHIQKSENDTKGPKIPLDLLGIVRLGQLISEQGVGLNEIQDTNSLRQPTQSAYELSGDLLFTLISLYVKHSFHKDGKFITNWSEIQSTREYKFFISQCQMLQFVNVGSLTREEKIAFFCNIYATLAIHIHIVAGPPTIGIKKLNPFFSAWYYNIGGDNYSLNVIKHGILRGTFYFIQIPF